MRMCRLLAASGRDPRAFSSELDTGSHFAGDVSQQRHRNVKSLAMFRNSDIAM